MAEGMNNAIMEQLLEQLLKESKAQGGNQAAFLSKLATRSGIDPKVVAKQEKKLGDLGNRAEQGAKSTGKLAAAGELAGKVLGDVVNGLVATAGNLVNFGVRASVGASSMEDFFASFKDIPIVGVAAGLFAALTRVQKETLEAFRSLTTTGINFGEGLSQLRTDALASGLTLEQFVKNLKDSSDTLMFIGTTANQGAKNLKNINLEITKSGGFGEQLRSLGFSYQDLNALTVSYARTVGGLNRQQASDYKGVAEAAVAYGKELDLLARITGKSREAQQKELEEQMQESNFQAFLATLDPAEAKKLQTQVMEAMAVAGKGGADIVKAQAMGISVQGEQGKLLTSLGGDLAQRLRDQTDAAMNTTVTVEQFKQQSVRRVAELQSAAAEAYPRIAKPMQALALQGENVAQTIKPLADNFTALRNAGAQDLETRARQIAEEAAKQAEAMKNRDKELQSMLDAEAAMRDFNAKMSTVIKTLSEKLLFPIMDLVSKNLPGMADTIANFINNLFSEDGRQEIIKSLSEGLKGIIADTWTNFSGGPSASAQQQDQANWNQMSVLQKAESGAARALEKFASFLGLDFIANNAAKSRIQSETNALGGGRAFGSYGVTGKLFEDFGKGTNVTLHGTESVVTPSQLSALMDGSAANNLKGLIEQLNSVNSQMLHTMKQVAEHTRRNVDATKALSNDAFA